jgi:hypothetical protein
LQYTYPIDYFALNVTVREKSFIASTPGAPGAPHSINFDDVKGNGNGKKPVPEETQEQ